MRRLLNINKAKMQRSKLKRRNHNGMPRLKPIMKQKLAKYEADLAKYKKELAEYPAGLQAYKDEQAVPYDLL